MLSRLSQDARGVRERAVARARALTDALASMLRAAVELDADTVVVSLDGKCTYDTVSRPAFLGKLAEVAPAVVPFLRCFSARTSTYLWWGDAGACHRISQGEGCEQGDALAPRDWLAAFLDDLHIKTRVPRARAALDSVAGEVARHARVQTNAAKTRVYRATPGPAPADLAVLGPDVRRADKPLAERGLLVLGSALGSAELVAAHGGERARAEEDLLQQLPERVAPVFSMRSPSLAPRATHGATVCCCPLCQGARRSNLDYGPRFARKHASRGRRVGPRARLGINASA